MFTWSHLFSHAESFGREADRQVIEASLPRSRPARHYRAVIGRRLVAIGMAIAGPEESRCLHSAEASR